MGETRPVKLRYTPEALTELRDILDSIALQSPQGAKRVQARIQTTVNLLLEYPHSGVATDEKPMRRIAVRPYPYLIFYEPNPEEVVVVGVRHAARNPASMPGRSQ